MVAIRAARVLTAAVVTSLLVASVVVAAPLGGNLPLRKEAEAAEPNVWLPALLLLACAGVAGGILVWQRGAGVLASAARRAPRDVRGTPSRLASLPLTQQASVHVIRWKGDEFLLACTAQQVTVLSRREAAAGVEEQQ